MRPDESGVLVDSNVLIDVFEDDPDWADWSGGQLERLTDKTRLVLNPIIYAEISIGYSRIEELDEAIHLFQFERQALPWDAAFLAGKAFALYKKRGGKRSAPLPDFHIGAHAAVSGLALLTRDPRRYREYFTGLKLISPE